jgi:hypothetical protein
MIARTLQPDDRRAEGEDGQFRKQCRENWARLIKKILEVDPLICSKCQGVMKIISFIEDPPVIHRILVHLNLWEVPKRSPPVSPSRDFIYDSDFLRIWSTETLAANHILTSDPQQNRQCGEACP